MNCTIDHKGDVIGPSRLKQEQSISCSIGSQFSETLLSFSLFLEKEKVFVKFKRWMLYIVSVARVQLAISFCYISWERERERERKRQRERESVGETQREWERQRESVGEIERDRDRDRERETEERDKLGELRLECKKVLFSFLLLT